MWVSAVTFRADYTANQSGSPRADLVFSQYQPVPTAPAIAVHDCPEWELVITNPGLCLSYEVQEVECSWFISVAWLKSRKLTESNIEGEKVCFSSEFPSLWGSHSRAWDTGHITFSLEQRTTDTYVLKLTFCTHRIREWNCPPGVRVFPYQLRQSTQSLVDMPTGQPSLDSPTLKHSPRY